MDPENWIQAGADRLAEELDHHRLEIEKLQDKIEHHYDTMAHLVQDWTKYWTSRMMEENII